MKKLLTISIAMLIAGIASADIAVNLVNNGGFLTTDGSSYVDTAFVQLVWNATSPSTTVDASLSNAGDYVLSSLTTTLGYAGTWSDQALGVQTWANSVVDDANILAGYLTVRIYDTAAMVAGDTYLQFDLDVDGTLTEYNNLVASTVYNTSGLISGDFGSSTYTVVPEPATIGLFGLGALSAWIVRRNKIKATEEA
jgi:hypothetical protein